MTCFCVWWSEGQLQEHDGWLLQCKTEWQQEHDGWLLQCKTEWQQEHDGWLLQCKTEWQQEHDGWLLQCKTEWQQEHDGWLLQCKIGWLVFSVWWGEGQLQEQDDFFAALLELGQQCLPRDTSLGLAYLLSLPKVSVHVMSYNKTSDDRPHPWETTPLLRPQMVDFGTVSQERFHISGKVVLIISCSCIYSY